MTTILVLTADLLIARITDFSSSLILLQLALTGLNRKKILVEIEYKGEEEIERLALHFFRQ